MTSDFLKIGNPRRVKQTLAPILQPDALDAIEKEIAKHTSQMYKLALNHLRFAKGVAAKDWRQKVSRFYYATYLGSKAVRFYSSGEHSEEGKDHQRVGLLPDDFPNRNTFANQLAVLHEDRKTCDYDHMSGRNDLVLSLINAEELATDFLNQVRDYLATKGVVVRGRP